jgi:hypothetical protein
MDDNLSALRKYRPDVHSLLRCSPFQGIVSLDGELTADLFFTHLFVTTEVLESLEGALEKALSNEYRHHQMIFLEGLPKTGKTTFIHHFLRSRRSTFDASVIDLSSLEHDQRSVSEDNPIIGNLKAILRWNFSSAQGFADFIRQKAVSLTREGKYFSQKTDEGLRELTKRISDDALTNLLREASMLDTLMLFFLYHCWVRATAGQSEQTYLVVFDNLDSVDLTRFTIHFVEEFARALERFSPVPLDNSVFAEKVFFNKLFKFLFCLRDANYSLLNAHLADLIHAVAPAIPFRIGFDSDLYQKAVVKRLELFSTLNEDENVPSEINHIRNLLKAFAQDYFFTDYIAPLCNFNITTLSRLLYSAAEELAQQPSRNVALDIESTTRILEGRDTSGYNEVYAARGVLLFGILKQLHDSDFLRDYPFSHKFSQAVADDEGYCLVIRTVLSLVLNRSNLRLSEDAIKQTAPFQDVPLRGVVRDALKLHGTEDIFDALSNSFLLEKKRYIHLLTFRNRAVESDDDFKPEIEYIREHDGQVPRSLDYVQVTLNPSGFVFLKFVLPQFEFYSVLAGNPNSLFTAGLSTEGHRPKYLFEVYIEKVQRVVQKHVSWMKLLWEKKAAGEWPNPDDYLRSSLVFKHFSKRAPKGSGYFHATRLVDRHAEHLDIFRLWLLHHAQANDAPNKSELTRVNKSLVGYIENYLGYMDNFLKILGPWASKESDASYNWFRRPAREAIQTIKKSGFEDFKTAIVPSRISRK